MPEITIDGETVEAITIDGEEVVEVTMDGDVVWELALDDDLFLAQGIQDLDENEIGCFEILENKISLVWSVLHEEMNRAVDITIHPDGDIWLGTTGWDESSAGHVVHLDKNGNYKWSKELDTGGMMQAASQTSVDKNKNSYTEGTTASLWSIDSNGNENWSLSPDTASEDFTSWATSQVADDEHLYAGVRGSDEFCMVKIYAGNGDIEWVSEALDRDSYGDLRWTLPLPNGDYIFAVTDEGYLIKFNSSGDIEFTEKIGTEFRSCAIDSSHNLYMGDYTDDKIYKVDDMGEVIWEYHNADIRTMRTEVTYLKNVLAQNLSNDNGFFVVSTEGDLITSEKSGSNREGVEGAPRYSAFPESWK